MRKLGILSDAHLGYRQYGLEVRWNDFNKALLNGLYRLASAGVKDIVVAGDLLHMSRPTSRTMEAVKKISEWCEKNGLHVMVIRGNHDYTSPHWLTTIRTPYRQPGTLPVGLHYVHDELVTCENSGITVYAKGFESPDIFRRHVFPKADVLVAHQSVKELVGFGVAQSLTYSELPTSDYRLLVIGDTHITKIDTFNGATILSPGSTEMNADAEPVDKYAFIADLSGETVQLEKLKLDTRSVIKARNVTESSHVDEIISAVTEEAAKNSRLTVSVQYAREAIPHLSRLREFCATKGYLFRGVPLPSTGKLINRPDAVAGRDLIEIARDEIQDEDVMDLVSRILTQPEETSTITDDWLTIRLPSLSGSALEV